MKYILAFIFVMIAIIVIFLLEGLLWWGIGNLIIFLLQINFTWTYIHGFVLGIVLSILKNIFGRNN